MNSFTLMPNETMHIAVCFDHGFVMPTGVMMYSVCVNNLDVAIRFHAIIDDSVTDNDKETLRDMVRKYGNKEIAFYEIDITCFPSFPNLRGEVSQAAYYRLMLSKILPVDLDKILYLDGDLIVRHSLIPLWNVDLKNVGVAVVSDLNDCAISFYNRLRYPSSLGYFNSGVMLVNLSYWRNNNTVKDFIEFIEKYPDRIRYWDQDVLNYTFRDRKIELPIKYNLQRGHLTKYAGYDYWKREQEVLEARRDPVIVHFTGSDKPWNKKLKFRAHPFTNTFYKYQNQTMWKGEKIDKRSKKQKAKDLIVDILRYCGIISPPRIVRSSMFVDLEPVD